MAPSLLFPNKLRQQSSPSHISSFDSRKLKVKVTPHINAPSPRNNRRLTRFGDLSFSSVSTAPPASPKTDRSFTLSSSSRSPKQHQLPCKKGFASKFSMTQGSASSAVKTQPSTASTNSNQNSSARTLPPPPPFAPPRLSVFQSKVQSLRPSTRPCEVFEFSDQGVYCSWNKDSVNPPRLHQEEPQQMDLDIPARAAARYESPFYYAHGNDAFKAWNDTWSVWRESSQMDDSVAPPNRKSIYPIPSTCTTTNRNQIPSGLYDAIEVKKQRISKLRQEQAARKKSLFMRLYGPGKRLFEEELGFAPYTPVH